MRVREGDKPKPDKWAVRRGWVAVGPPKRPLEEQRRLLAIVRRVATGELTLEAADQLLAEILGHHVVPQV